uniref:Paired domain-containing protein n=1 Tax=Parastrongyloides trichosuri TaxID=131310 RepID=A0A0N4Z0B9_PARTI
MNFVGSENVYSTIPINNDTREVIQDFKLCNVIVNEQLQLYYQQQEQLKLLSSSNNINVPSAFKPVDTNTLALSLQLSNSILLNNIQPSLLLPINNNNIVVESYYNQQSGNGIINYNPSKETSTYYQVTRNRHGRPYNPGRPLEMVDRKKILNLFQQGYKVSHIAKIIGVTHSCVSKIMSRYKKTGSINPRAPQIKKYSLTLPILSNNNISFPITRILNNSPSESSSSSSSSCSSITTIMSGNDLLDVCNNFDSLPKPVPIKNAYFVDRYKL